MKTFSYFLFTFILIVSLLGWFFYNQAYLPKDLPSMAEDKVFLVKKGESFFEIAENLEKANLIKNKFIFDFYIILKRKEKKLQAGEYYLNSSMSIVEISQKIVSGDILRMTITIPEGFTLEQIEERVNLKLPGENLEGFLFPDTYQFPFNVSGEEVVQKMRDNFETKLTIDLRKEIEKQEKTILEIVTMASLIEKEVKTLEDKKLVSGVLWKRLGVEMPLQVDVEMWTYQNIGLPLKPICNPGMESILAAIYPEESLYWYYLSSREGETIFSKTFQEHVLAKRQYLK